MSQDVTRCHKMSQDVTSSVSHHRVENAFIIYIYVYIYIYQHFAQPSTWPQGSQAWFIGFWGQSSPHILPLLKQLSHSSQALADAFDHWLHKTLADVTDQRGLRPPPQAAQATNPITEWLHVRRIREWRAAKVLSSFAATSLQAFHSIPGIGLKKNLQKGSSLSLWGYEDAARKPNNPAMQAKCSHSRKALAIYLWWKGT